MIDFARAADDPDRRWYPHQIDTPAAGQADLVWLCGGCTARVTARRSHTRGGTRVLAHFATWPRADDGPIPHDDNCEFLPHIYPRGSGRTSLSPGDQLQTSPVDQTAWVLATAAPTATPRAARVQMDPEQLDARSRRRSSIPSRRRPGPMRPTIASAHRVLDLLRLFDDKPMQMLRFTATWRPGASDASTELTWGDLYYPPGRHHLLLARARDNALPEHPVAVSGPVEHVAHTFNRRRRDKDLSIFLRLGAAGTSDRLVLRGPPYVLPVVEPGASLLALATWTAFTPRGAQSPTYCTAWPTETGQVLELGNSDPYR